MAQQANAHTTANVSDGSDGLVLGNNGLNLGTSPLVSSSLAKSTARDRDRSDFGAGFAPSQDAAPSGTSGQPSQAQGGMVHESAMSPEFFKAPEDSENPASSDGRKDQVTKNVGVEESSQNLNVTVGDLGPPSSYPNGNAVANPADVTANPCFVIIGPG